MRHGTVLIFAIAVTTLLMTLVFGFVRVAELQRNAGSATTPMLLARETALAGAQHALEQIVREHADPSEPVTRLDGPAHAVFRPILFPWLRDKNQIDPRLPDSRLIGINDSTTEDLIPNCGWSLAWSYQRGGYAYGSIDPLNPALSNWDGRGRWYELEMTNPPVASTPAIPAGGDATTGVIRFSDGDGELMDHRNGNANDAASVATPARCAPIMYDRAWRRLPYANADEAVALRETARYRLRYAVGVRDLEGTLLVNPDPGLDWRAVNGNPDPTAYVDPAVARVVRAWHAFPHVVNLMTHSSAQVTGRFGAGARAGHVLIGRGSAANFARTSAADPWPRTFPLMYRGTYDPDRFWRHLRANPQNIGVALWAMAPPEVVRGPFADLFANSSGGATGLISAGLAPGGEQIANAGPSDAWRHVLAGPQFSPLNVSLAMSGGQDMADASDGMVEEAMLGLTPFGQGVRKSGAADPTADTPWSINALTAPQNVLRAVVLGSLPAGVLQVRYELKPLSHPNGANYQRTPGTNSTEYWGVFRSRNLWVRTQSSALSRYEPPARHQGNDRTQPVVLAPDYHVLSDRPGPDPVAQPAAAEQGFIHPTLRYPGPVAWNVASTNGNTGSAASWHDDLGMPINVSDQPLIRDIYFRKGTFDEDDDKYSIAATVRRSCNTDQNIVDPFLAEFPTDIGWVHKDTAVDKNPKDKGTIGSDSLWDRMRQDYTASAIQVHTDSFYRDIVYAFANGVAMARLANCRLPVGDYTPTASDVAHSGVLTTRPTTVAELDALFLRCLGIDIANPASGPVQGWCGDGQNKAVAFTPNANIFSVAGSGITRNVVLAIGEAPTAVNATLLTQVMERMLNDFRLTLLGSHPSYTAFRPLDFNGDGRVACSGYAANPTHGPGTMAYRCHVEQDAPASAGSGPAVATPFSIAGNLKLGRSRFWEVWVRGEVFDNLSKRAVSQATVQTVFVVDPRQAGAAARHQDSHVLYRRWHYNMNKGMMATGY
jgi:hypothetical protein